MTVLRNEVRPGTYLDSVALMRISRTLAERDGVADAGVMIGTEPNKQILREAHLLGPEGEAALPGDLIIAVRAADEAATATAVAEAKRLIDQPKRSSGPAAAWRPRTLQAALKELPDANLALISVPGDFAAPEARKALSRGLHVMIFSDNVPLAEEVALKQEAREPGLLVMGPDCGTAIINGAPLAFANVVPRGDIGIIGASGTGIQEVSCLIARSGCGVSHAIGTGGRDLKAEVGAITTLMAIDLLEADPATRHIVLISKPPAASVARAVLDRIGRSAKPATVCFIGGEALAMPANVRFAATLKAAAERATGRAIAGTPAARAPAPARGRLIRGLFAGGTLCAESQIVLRGAGLAVMSNTPVPGASPLRTLASGHSCIDLGDDEFTRGRPHPMIEPAVRDAPLAAALADPAVGVVLLDCVLGWGGHMDPAGHLAARLAGRPSGGPAIIASVTGTDADPQGRAEQVRRLEAVGVTVAPSNADATALALSAISAR